MDDQKANNASSLLLLAPVIFICHFLEEAPRFVPWFNEHVARGITAGLFWRVNLTALALTLIVVACEWFSRSAFSLAGAIAWLSFLMLANAIFHIAGAVVDKQYVPGLATAILLYLPYYTVIFMRAIKSKQVGVNALVGASVIGSLPMLMHGYLIIFRGSRLF
jgi:hypothetical protein